MAEHIADLLLERYVIGAATPEEKARVEASAEAMVRVEELRRDNATVLASHPPAHVAAVVRARAASADTAARAWPLMWLAPMVAVACAVLFMVIPREDGEDIRLKGIKAHLTLYRQVDSTSEKLVSGAAARPGDTVQVAYTAGEATYGAIVSVDGRSNVTVHTPSSGDGKLSQKNEVLLPRAYTLDDAPRFERFVFVAGVRPIDLAKLQKLLHATPELEADKLREALGAATVDVFTLRKEP